MIALPVIKLTCANGPKEGTTIEAPNDLFPGRPCALPWRTVKGKHRYAVYMVTGWPHAPSLSYLKSYDTPERAERKVQDITYFAMLTHRHLSDGETFDTP